MNDLDILSILLREDVFGMPTAMHSFTLMG
jgi:hypothetical protein